MRSPTSCTESVTANLETTPTGKSATDILSMITHHRGPIRAEQLTDEEANRLMEAARPYGSRRRDGYFISMQRGWWHNILQYTGVQSPDAAEVLENVDPGLLTQQGHYVANHILRLV